MIINSFNKNVLTISYYFTMACNNRCEYCYKLNELNNKLLINNEVFDMFKKSFNSLDRSKKINLVLLGGDPLFVDEIQRFREIDFTNVDVLILSNCNFEPKKFEQKIKSLNFLNFKIHASHHLSSNQKYFKENVKYLKENNLLDVISILVNDNNVNKLKNLILFFKDNNYNIAIMPLKTNNSDFLDLNKETKKLFELTNNKNFISVDDVELTEYEAYNLDFKHLSHFFYLKCEFSNIFINYNGEITYGCSYKLTDHIKNGIKIKTLLCNNNECYCDFNQYKEIIKSKNLEQSNKILNFIKNKKVNNEL